MAAPLWAEPGAHPEVPAIIEAADAAELAQNAKALGIELSWLIGQVAATLDRRADVAAVYAKETDTKVLMKLSAELRLLDKAVAGLLKGIETDVPVKDSLTTVKTRQAANVRWQREREGNDANS